MDRRRSRDIFRQARQSEREKRAQRPSEIRRAQERAEDRRLMRVHFETDWQERFATPFYEIFAEAFDLADPNLWKSNSFAMVRPRLLTEVRAAIANLEYELHHNRTNNNRRRASHAETEAKLARAREILALLDDGSAPR